MYSYSLVTYLPSPLAEFLDSLRAALVPGCTARSHLTVLPPRPLTGTLAQAEDEIANAFERAERFSVTLEDVGVFPGTGVVFVSVGQGREALERLHAQANGGSLQFRDTHEFHPHVTLAQGLPAGELDTVHSLAATAWAQYQGPRSFTVEQLCLVECSEQGFRDVALFEGSLVRA